jgi:hypothetical protein
MTDYDAGEAIWAMADHRDPPNRRVTTRHVVTYLNALSQEWSRASNGMGPDGPFVDVAGDYAGVPSFPAMLGQMLELHVEKQRQYRGSDPDPLVNYVRAGASIGVRGWQAAYMRLAEKMTRAQTVLRAEHVDPEDTMLDIAVLALLVLELHKHNR